MHLSKIHKLLILTLVLALAVAGTIVRLREVQVPRIMEMSDHTVAETIRSLQPGEELKLRVNSYGGEVTSALEIMNALELTKGTVTAEVDGMAASAAGIILTKVSHIDADPHSIVLIHTVVNGNGQKMNDTDPMIAWMNQQLKDATAGLLTPEERYHVFVLHEDLWLDAHIFVARFDALKAGHGQSLDEFVPPTIEITMVPFVPQR